MLDFLALAQECAPWVAPQTMAAIVKTESGFNPLSIGVNGGARLVRQPADKAEAVSTAKWLIEKGYNIDLGLGQVNSSNLAKTKLSVDDAFDACKNLAAAATILKLNYDNVKGKIEGEQPALRAAISAYNTGTFTKGITNGYVQKVVNNAQTSVPSITPQSVLPIPLINPAAGKTKSAMALPATGNTQGPAKATRSTSDHNNTPARSANVFSGTPSEAKSSALVF